MPSALASAGINQQLSFTGKLVKSDGTNITNGTYDMEFKIYQDGPGNVAGDTGGTLKWTEDWIVGGAGGITLTNGTFQVNLGAGTDSASLDSAISWNQSVLWLSLQIGQTTTCTVSGNFQTNCGGDGEMVPMIRLTAVPYSINAEQLGGVAASSYVQLGATQSGNINIGSGSVTAGSISLGTGTVSAASIDSASSAAALGVGITNAGQITIGNTTNSTVLFKTKNVATAFQVQNGSGNAILTIDTSATETSNDVTLGKPSTINGRLIFDNSSNTNTVTLVSGATGGTYSLTLPTTGPTTSKCLQTDSVTASLLTFGACGTGGGGTLQNAYDSSASPAVITTSSGTKGISITAGAVPTADLLTITNAGQASATAGADGLEVNYVGGAAAVSAEGIGIDLTPGTTSGGNWNGLRVTAAATGAVSGVTEDGIQVDGPTSPGSGTETGISVTSGWDIGLNLDSGGIQMAALAANPATPAAGELRVYAYKIAGRTMLKTIGPSGVDFALQPSLFQQSIFLVTPGSDTTATVLNTTGGSITKLGTFNAAVGGVTEAQGFMGNVVSLTTTTSGYGFGNNVTQYFRGSGGTNADGFFFFARISLPDTLTTYTNSSTGARLFFGLSSLNGVGATTNTTSDAPSGSYAGFFYAPAKNANDFLFTTDNGTTINNIDTTVALAQSKTYDMYVYCKPGDSTIYWRIDNLTDGIAPVEGNTGTDLPATTTAMRSVVNVTTLSTTTTHNVRFQRVYVETDR